MTEQDPPVANPWMADGMTTVHELKRSIQRQLRRATPEQMEQFFTGAYGALAGFAAGAMGEAKAVEMVGHLHKALQESPIMPKNVVN